MKSTTARALAVTSALGIAGATALVGVLTTSAAAAPSTVYVSATGAAGKADTSCTSAAYKSVQAGVNAVATGGSVVVCGGTYAESVTVTRKVSLVGQSGATINATGAPYGIGLAASYSSVTGFTVKNAGAGDDAPNDGIVSAGFINGNPVTADHLTISNNTLTSNAGNGIDINSSQYDTVTGNIANYNGVGINVSDDLGRAAMWNKIDGNRTDYNTGGCGIALADHSGKGILWNTVSNNRSDYNGLLTPTAPDASSGSGVILASPIPNGWVAHNVITANSFSENGHGGVVMHSHVPGANLNANTISNNRIQENNVRTDENDLKTTGIYLGSAGPVSVTVSGNTIGPDYYGIFTSGPVTVTGSGNAFTGITGANTGHAASF